MNENPQMTPAPASPSRSGGLAVASLVLGILACILSLVLIGGFLGVAGLLLGLVYISKRQGRNAVAWWGVGLSLVGMIASVGLGVVYFRFLNSGFRNLTSLDSWEGVRAPEIALTTLDGKTLRLGDLKGKRIVLDFWATWCGPCVVEIPHFIRLSGETSPEELVVIGVSNESEEVIRPFALKKGMNYAVASASGLPSPYGDLRAIPTTFFIDRNGVIQSILVGSRGYEELKRHALAPDVPGAPKPPPAPDVTVPGSQK
jgi:peroxiredoxin